MLVYRIAKTQYIHEYNLLLNPLHPDMQQVSISQVDAYTFDARLVR